MQSKPDKHARNIIEHHQIIIPSTRLQCPRWREAEGRPIADGDASADIRGGVLACRARAVGAEQRCLVRAVVVGHHFSVLTVLQERHTLASRP